MDKKLKALTECLEDYDYESLFSITQPDDLAYVFYKVYDSSNQDESFELLDSLLDYTINFRDSNMIAEYGNNIYACAADHFDVSLSIDDCRIFSQVKWIWIVKLFMAAIKKAETSEDKDYVNKLLGFQGRDIENIRNLDMLKAHKYTSNNKQYIQKSKMCGCCYCQSMFKSNEVVQYVGNSTAICPNCAIDSVVCDEIVPITKDLLSDMYLYWFK